MKLTIDRFEGDIAVCEKSDRTMLNIPRHKLPLEAKEGDILILEGENITLDVTESQKRREEIRKRVERLWK